MSNHGLDGIDRNVVGLGTQRALERARFDEIVVRQSIPVRINVIDLSGC
jgi:hypothetical protein